MMFKTYILCFLLCYVRGAEVSFFSNNFRDDIDNEVIAKFMRVMVNQTKADTLHLPANATSIRKNITDTFSCKGRMYGYYADVDNDCQVFHVCLPTKGPSGRNTTYRWSFICPKQTVFNQDVMVCSRKIDSIACADSPMYYYKNMEFGKIPNKTDEQKDMETNSNNMFQANEHGNPMNFNSNRKNYNKRKQNIVTLNLERINEYMQKNEETSALIENNRKSLEEVGNEWNGLNENKEDTERIAEERSLNKKLLRMKPRRTFRFKADAI